MLKDVLPDLEANNSNTIYSKETFPVLEMSCAACAVSVESMLKSVTGVKDAAVNFANQDVWIAYNPLIASPESLRNAVRSIGYDIVIEKENQQDIKEAAQIQHYEVLKKRTIWSSIISLPVVVIGMFFMNIPYANYIMMALATPVVFYFGRQFFVNAWKQARYKKANMDTLVALSTGVAWLFSAFYTLFPDFWHQRGIHAHVYFEAAAVVIAFISLGKLLEEKAKSRTSSAIKKLMGLQPKTVMIVLEDNETKEIPVSAIIPGNILLVRPGDKLAVDGVVTDGGSFVDESMISGEPVPVEKLRGDQVFAGTINQLGSFKIRAEKVGSETVLSQIIKMVQEAQGSKAPVQKLVDKISGIFVPVVIIISIVTFLTWMIAGGENAFTHALLNAITVLVIACPCALGLATPTAIMVGIGKGAENNILIKDADSLELAHKVNAVVLDKTGTITEGKPGVSEIVFIDGVDNEKFKAILFSLELQSEHPLAGAVTKHLKNEGVAKVNVQGITGQFEGVSYTAGNQKFLMEKGISMDVRLSDRFDQLQQEAKTVIAFAEGVQVIAIIAIADKIKSSSVRAVKNLGNLGIDVYMLTGDNLSTATAIARETGITTFKAEMLPAEKATFVKDLQAKGKVVAMAGDGINDSQALAQADLSIAMGKGSDIAMDVAQMTLITSDLTSIASALTLSRKTVSTIKQNLFWAFFYNLIGIPLAAGILYSFNGFLLDPMIAGAAMALSSVSVVGNSLRLKMAKI